MDFEKRVEIDRKNRLNRRNQNIKKCERKTSLLWRKSNYPFMSVVFVQSVDLKTEQIVYEFGDELIAIGFEDIYEIGTSTYQRLT